jgi:RimJ/RimL family protein N-acetyltransferase
MDELLRRDGVTLRRWRPADTDAMFGIVCQSLEHLRPWMPWAADGYTREKASQYIERSQAEWEAGEAYNFAILAPDDRMVGSCGLMARIGAGGLEIGYWVHQAYTGRGIATAAAGALVEAAFGLPEITHVEIHHDLANEASGAIPRRLGFTEVERRPDKPVATGEVGERVIWRLTRP